MIAGDIRPSRAVTFSDNKSRSIPRRVPKIPDFLKEGTQTSQLKGGTQTSQVEEVTQTSQVEEGTQTSQVEEGTQTSHTLIREGGTNILTFSTLSDKGGEPPGNHKEVVQGPISRGNPSSLKKQEIVEKVVDTKQFLLNFYMMKSKLKYAH